MSDKPTARERHGAAEDERARYAHQSRVKAREVEAEARWRRRLLPLLPSVDEQPDWDLPGVVS